MSRPRVLDLFCGAGGAGMGYQRAGFEVVGVDIKPQPDYPFEFVQGDWSQVPIEGFDLIHASPPCQAYLTIAHQPQNLDYDKSAHALLYEPVRDRLADSGIPYVIENPAARPDAVLCGEMFMLDVIRHRRFELGRWKTSEPRHVPHRGRVAGWRHGAYYEGPYVSPFTALEAKPVKGTGAQAVGGSRRSSSVRTRWGSTGRKTSGRSTRRSPRPTRNGLGNGSSTRPRGSRCYRYGREGVHRTGVLAGDAEHPVPGA